MSRVIGHGRTDGLPALLPGWVVHGRVLQREFPVTDPDEGMAFVDAVRGLVPTASDSVVSTELRRATARVTVRSPGYVGVTDTDVRLAHGIDAAASRCLADAAARDASRRRLE